MIKKINTIIGVLIVFLLLDIKYYINYNWQEKRMNEINNNVISIDNKANVMNDDIIGKISILGINLNSDLVQGLDNEYYLSHDIAKNENESGTIFLDYQSDLNNSNKSYIYNIPYNELTKYLNKKLLKSNNIISINYLGNNINYKIVKVYESKKIKKLSKSNNWVVLKSCNRLKKGNYVYVIAQKIF